MNRRQRRQRLALRVLGESTPGRSSCTSILPQRCGNSCYSTRALIALVGGGGGMRILAHVASPLAGTLGMTPQIYCVHKPLRSSASPNHLEIEGGGMRVRLATPRLS